MHSSSQKKLYIKTWGCQMNVYDSRRMADILRPLGYVESDTPEDADMMILNTCHIREKATDKVFSEIGRMREYKDQKEKSGGRLIMAVAGCVAQAEGDYILERAPEVDLVFGPQNYQDLPEMILKLNGGLQSRLVYTDFPEDSKFDYLPSENTQGIAAFLAIQEGCDKFCTFCVVPYTRGAEYSRGVQEVLDEAKRLRDGGAKDITLLGQNVNAYHGAGPDGSTWSLGRLCAEIAEIDGIEQIRYITSHPRDVDDELIAAHRDIQKLMPFLHLPIQHGSDEILKRMNRKHTAAHYLDIIAKLRAARPDLALSSDFIIGFPGETEQHVEETLELVRQVGYASAYSFKYSPRPGTPAANMPAMIREDVKTERLLRLQALLFAQQKAFNKNTVGLTIPVLFDRFGRDKTQLHGRTHYNQSIHVDAPASLLGQIVPVKITGASQSAVSGVLASTEEKLRA